MKPRIIALSMMFASVGLYAQKTVWQPSPGHTQLPIWPGAAPDPQPVAGPEFAQLSGTGWPQLAEIWLKTIGMVAE